MRTLHNIRRSIRFCSEKKTGEKLSWGKAVHDFFFKLQKKHIPLPLHMSGTRMSFLQMLPIDGGLDPLAFITVQCFGGKSFPPPAPPPLIGARCTYFVKTITTLHRTGWLVNTVYQYDALY